MLRDDYFIIMVLCVYKEHYEISVLSMSVKYYPDRIISIS